MTISLMDCVLPSSLRRGLAALGVISGAMMLGACATTAPAPEALSKPLIPAQAAASALSLTEAPPAPPAMPDVDRQIVERYFSDVFVEAPSAGTTLWVFFENDGRLIAAGRESPQASGFVTWEVRNESGALLATGSRMSRADETRENWLEQAVQTIRKRVPNAKVSEDTAIGNTWPIQDAKARMVRDEAGAPVSLVSVWPGATATPRTR